jgi:hypothetical protein
LGILEGLEMEDVGICYGHFVYFIAKLYILWPFDTFCGRLVLFPRPGTFNRGKSGSPDRPRGRLLGRRKFANGCK